MEAHGLGLYQLLGHDISSFGMLSTLPNLFNTASPISKLTPLKNQLIGKTIQSRICSDTHHQMC